jgi:hypothetical protein
MTNRVSYPPQDFQKMCKQAERDQESKKLVLLMERVKRQIAERQNPELKRDNAKDPAKVRDRETNYLRMPSRSVPFER